MKYNFLLLGFLLLAFTFGCKDKEVSAEEQAKIDDQVILDYAKDNNLTLKSGPKGIYYIVEKAGTGTAHPTEASILKVHYKGTLLNGTEFDTSYGGSPFKFQLYQVIEGWQVGIPLMVKGEKTKLFIPSGLAYGKKGSGIIPENAVLIFDIELINL